MYPQATAGIKANNDKFSPCSVSSIGNLLLAKKDKCFVSKYFLYMTIGASQ